MSKPTLGLWNTESVAAESAGLFLLACTLEEMWSVAEPERAAAFLRAVGRRIARDNPVAALQTTDEILAAMNAFWAERGWGHTDLRFAEQGLRIDHKGLPLPPFDMPSSRWDASVAAVLAGAYDEWLAALGGGPDMRTQLVAIRGHEAEFAYGG